MFHYGYSVHAKIKNMKRDLYRFAKYRRELEEINEIGNRILKYQLVKELKAYYNINTNSIR